MENEIIIIRIRIIEAREREHFKKSRLIEIESHSFFPYFIKETNGDERSKKCVNKNNKGKLKNFKFFKVVFSFLLLVFVSS